MSTLFSGKYRNSIINLSSAEFAQRVEKVKKLGSLNVQLEVEDTLIKKMRSVSLR